MRDAGAAVLLTTQYLEEADQLADDIIIIDRGAMVASGTSGELKAQLGQDVLEITVADPGRREDALTALATRQAVAIDARSVHLSVAGPDDSLEALRRVGDAGIELADFQLRRPTLDDVFIEITGRPATQAARAGEEVPA
jgi:ABC-type multidrug transport system ATPase subunit